MEHGTWIVKGDQAMARECYSASLSEKLPEEAMMVNEEKGKKTTHTAELVEDLLEVLLDINYPTRKFGLEASSNRLREKG